MVRRPHHPLCRAMHPCHIGTHPWVHIRPPGSLARPHHCHGDHRDHRHPTALEHLLPQPRHLQVQVENGMFFRQVMIENVKDYNNEN